MHTQSVYESTVFFVSCFISIYNSVDSVPYLILFAKIITRKCSYTYSINICITHYTRLVSAEKVMPMNKHLLMNGVADSVSLEIKWEERKRIWAIFKITFHHYRCKIMAYLYAYTIRIHRFAFVSLALVFDVLNAFPI